MCICDNLFNDMCLLTPACAFAFCAFARLNPHLRGVDSSLQEGAVAGVLRAHVAIFAPVTGEVSVNTGQAPAAGERWWRENKRG